MIAGAGFARMAWRLAQERTRPSTIPWPHKHAAAQCWNGPSAEYFQIIDRAADAFEIDRHFQLVGFGMLDPLVVRL